MKRRRQASRQDQGALMTRILIDCDPGHDDLVAIMLAASVSCIVCWILVDNNKLVLAPEAFVIVESIVSTEG